MTTSISDSGVQFADGSVQASAGAPQLIPISASVGSNALTITLNPCALAFRSTTLGSGASTTVQNNATLSLTVPSSATLGTVNAVQSDVVVLAINNAGTIELAVVNIAGGNDLSETGLISTTAISAGSTSASTVYSTSARTSVAYRVVGVVRSTQTTAGTWAAAPSLVQGAGGAALEAMQSLGYGQTWQNVTGSRTAGTVYYNTTGKPIQLAITYTQTASGSTTVNVSGLAIASGQQSTVSGGQSLMPIVPAGASYSLTNVSNLINTWYELR